MITADILILKKLLFVVDFNKSGHYHSKIYPHLLPNSVVFFIGGGGGYIIFLNFF